MEGRILSIQCALILLMCWVCPFMGKAHGLFEEKHLAKKLKKKLTHIERGTTFSCMVVEKACQNRIYTFVKMHNLLSQKGRKG